MHFLIVKTSAFGDIVHTYPVIHFLKEQYPNCQIDWVVEDRMKELVASHPLVDTVITIDSKSSLLWPIHAYKKLRAKRYDVLFDLQGNSKSALITMCARAKDKVGFGFKTTSEAFNPLVLDLRFNPPKGLNVRQENLFIVQAYAGVQRPLSQESGLKLGDEEIDIPPGSWLICPGSRWPNKKLSIETLLAFLRKIESAYSPSFIFLAGSEAEFAEALSMAEQFPHKATVFHRPKLALLHRAMGKVELVLAMDSLPLHLASTTTTPTFSIFGASSAAKYAPWGPQHGHVQGSCPYGQTFERRCKLLRTCKTGACIRQMDADELFAQFSKWWASAAQE